MYLVNVLHNANRIIILSQRQAQMNDKLRDIFLGIRGVSAFYDTYETELKPVFDMLERLTPIDGRSFTVELSDSKPDSRNFCVRAGFGASGERRDTEEFRLSIDANGISFRHTELVILRGGSRTIRASESVYTDFSALRRRIGQWINENVPERAEEAAALFNPPPSQATSRALPAAKPIKFDNN